MTAAHTVTPKVSELDWRSHPAGIGGERATIVFANGFGASVLRGGPFYTTNGTYEIAVIDERGELTSETTVTSDVLGYLSEEEANEALSEIASLPARGAA